jgi:hypothetical protein
MVYLCEKSRVSITQIENKPSSDSNITPKIYKPKNWSLSSTGFITIPNYWIEGRQPDLRLDIYDIYFLKVVILIYDMFIFNI